MKPAYGFVLPTSDRNRATNRERAAWYRGEAQVSRIYAKFTNTQAGREALVRHRAGRADWAQNEVTNAQLGAMQDQMFGRFGLFDEGSSGAEFDNNVRVFLLVTEFVRGVMKEGMDDAHLTRLQESRLGKDWTGRDVLVDAQGDTVAEFDRDDRAYQIGLLERLKRYEGGNLLKPLGTDDRYSNFLRRMQIIEACRELTIQMDGEGENRETDEGEGRPPATRK